MLIKSHDDILDGMDVRPADWMVSRGIPTITAYKAFRLIDDKLYPPQHPNKNRLHTPYNHNHWLMAHDPEGIDKSVNRPKTHGGGKGTGNKHKTLLAYRPGWHLSALPTAPQFRVTNPVTKIRSSIWPSDIVWCQCEMPADPILSNQYQSICDANNAKYPMMGMQAIPHDGYYQMQTNKINKDAGMWYITGAIRILKLLDWDEVMNIMTMNGADPYPVIGYNDK